MFLMAYLPAQGQYLHEAVDAIGGTPAARIGEAILHARNGDVVVCGRYDDTLAFVARYNEWGTERWLRTFQFGPDATKLLDIAEGADGRMVAVGTCQNCIALNADVGMILPLDSNGVMTTAQIIIPDSFAGYISGIAHTAQDDGFVTTRVRAAAFSDRSFVTKYDANLVETWEYECTGPSNATSIEAVLAIPGWGVFVGGGSHWTTDERPLIWRLDDSGNLVWHRRIVPPVTGYHRNAVHALAWDSAGQLVVGSGYYTGAANENEYGIFRFQPVDGTPIDSLIWGGPGLEEIRSLAVSSDGSILACGFQDAGDFFGPTAGDAVWFEISPQLVASPDRTWETLGIPNDHWVMEDIVAIDPISCNEPAFAACGYRQGSQALGLLWTASCLVGREDPIPFTPWQVYPNPVGPQQQVNIDLGTPLADPAHLFLYAIDGRLISHKRLSAGQQYLEIASPSASGTYLLRLTTGGRSSLHKLVVQ